jgi:hypothetical protein
MALGEILAPDSAITLFDHLVGEMTPTPKMEDCAVSGRHSPAQAAQFLKHVLDGCERSAQDDPRGPGS